VQVPVVDPRECATAVVRAASLAAGAPAGGAADHAETPAANRAAIVFGNEQSGLSNTELARCGALVHIPTNPAFSSLNLGMAVQVLCYELRMAWLAAAAAESARAAEAPPREIRLATAEELEHFHAHLEQLLTETGFLHPNHQKQIKL